ncbi:MAG: hypothetical protein U1E25_04060 [Methylocystis sp.]
MAASAAASKLALKTATLVFGAAASARSRRRAALDLRAFGVEASSAFDALALDFGELLLEEGDVGGPFISSRLAWRGAPAPP